MTDVSSALLAHLAGKPAGVRLMQALFVSADTTGALIDVQGSRIPAAMGTAFLPEVGEVVNVWNIDDRYLVMGPAAVKPDQGTVQSVTGGLVTLLTSIGTTVTCPYDGTTPSAGQVMKLLWHNGAFAMLMSTSPAPVVAPAPPDTGLTTHVDVFTAVDAGSYGSGRWWTPSVWASDNNVGAWFYGTKIADTIPAASGIETVELFVPASTQIQFAGPNFATHPHTSKPGGAPSLSVVGAIGITPGWVQLGSAFGNVLRNGGGSYGIGVSHGGYNIFPSLADDAMSGALRITSLY